ncbi:MAG: PilZ domain-containing protein [Candidatus Hodarchaeales archaeon]
MEKRRYKRFLIEQMDIHAKTIFATEVEMLDISICGARMKVPQNLKIGCVYFIKLENESYSFRLKCTVMWEKLSGSLKNKDGEFIPVYTAGIKFNNVYSDELKKLKDFIGEFEIPQEQKFGDEKRLNAMRVKFYTKESNLLNYQETYTVKLLSLGGILIETNIEFRIDERFPMELFLSNDNYPLKFQGRIASCIEILDKKPKQYNIGVEFLDITENDLSRLSEYTRNL